MTFFRAADLEGRRDLSYLSNALLAMHYRARYDPAEVYKAHVDFGEHAAKQYPPVARPPENKDPNRRLRVAYISADFCRHSVAFFIDTRRLAYSDVSDSSSALYTRVSR